MSARHYRKDSCRSSQESLPPSYISTPSEPPSYRSLPYETATVRSWPDQHRPWHSSVSLWAPTASLAGLSMLDLNAFVDSPASESAHAPVVPTADPATVSRIFVYYSVFTSTGAVRSRRPVDKRSPYVGRVEAMLIPPPHTVGSVVSCICKIEKVSRHGFAQLFPSASSPTPLDRNDRISILSGSGPGSDPNSPLAVLLPDQGRTQLRLKKAIVAYKGVNGHGKGFNEGWLNFSPGDILYTDGRIRESERYQLPPEPRAMFSFLQRLRPPKIRSENRKAYVAKNAKGEVGLVPTDYFSERSIARGVMTRLKD